MAIVLSYGGVQLLVYSALIVTTCAAPQFGPLTNWPKLNAISSSVLRHAVPSAFKKLVLPASLAQPEDSIIELLPEVDGDGDHSRFQFADDEDNLAFLRNFQLATSNINPFARNLNMDFESAFVTSSNDFPTTGAVEDSKQELPSSWSDFFMDVSGSVVEPTADEVYHAKRSRSEELSALN